MEQANIIEQIFKMQDIKWYITENSIIPFVENKSETKIKLLTNNRIVKIQMKEQCVGISPADDYYTEIVKDLNTTLFKATKKKGVVMYGIDMLGKYYFEKKSRDYVRNWLNTEIRTQEEILAISENVNANYNKSKEKKVKDSRDF